MDHRAVNHYSISQPNRRKGQLFSVPAVTLKLGPWPIESDIEIYYFSVALVILCLLAMGNMLRSKLGRAWVAIRDNDMAAELWA